MARAEKTDPCRLRVGTMVFWYKDEERHMLCPHLVNYIALLLYAELVVQWLNTNVGGISCVLFYVIIKAAGQLKFFIVISSNVAVENTYHVCSHN